MVERAELGGPDPLGQRRGPSVLIDLQGGAQACQRYGDDGEHEHQDTEDIRSRW
jgi:hypothetical protein